MVPHPDDPGQPISLDDKPETRVGQSSFLAQDADVRDCSRNLE